MRSIKKRMSNKRRGCECVTFSASKEWVELGCFLDPVSPRLSASQTNVIHVGRLVTYLSRIEGRNSHVEPRAVYNHRF